jgi:hypothetical protein
MHHRIICVLIITVGGHRWQDSGIIIELSGLGDVGQLELVPIRFIIAPGMSVHEALLSGCR